MNENTSYTIITCAASLVLCWLIFAVTSCQKNVDTLREQNTANERRDMLEHGYEYKPVPTRFDNAWVKKEESK